MFFGIIAIYLIFALLNAFLFQGLDQIPTHTRTLESILIIGYVLVHLYQIITEMKVHNLEKDYSFWISAGFLIYFSGALVNNIMANVLSGPENTILRQGMWALNALFLLILYTLIAFGLWTFRKQKIT